MSHAYVNPSTLTCPHCGHTAEADRQHVQGLLDRLRQSLGEAWWDAPSVS